MLNAFNFLLLDRDVTLFITCIDSVSEKKEWYSMLSLTPIEENFDKAWKELRKQDQDHSVIITTCPVTGDIQVHCFVDMNYDITFQKISIEITDQLLEIIEPGLSSKTYGVINGSTILNIKTYLLDSIGSYLVKTVEAYFGEEEDNISDAETDEEMIEEGQSIGDDDVVVDEAPKDSNSDSKGENV